MLPCQKTRFSLPEDVHYLNGAYMSPILRSVEEAGIAAIRRKRFPADITPDDFFSGADEARRHFARLIGAEGADAPGGAEAPEASERVDASERVAILPAVSYGIAVAARNTPIGAGQNVVLAEGQFPSNALVWRRIARERGAEVRTIPSPDRTVGRSRAWNERILEAIDGGTAAVALAPVHWTDGTVFRLAEIGERAREVGAAFVVDGTQSLGARPFDLGHARPDAVICAAYKWLLGPYSVAFGWFGQRYDGGTPLEEAWLARTRSDDFRSLVDYVEEYRPAAARYDVGGRSNFVLLPMAVDAMRQIQEWSVPAIQEYARHLTRDLFDPLAERGFLADEPDGRAAHLFGLRAPEGVDNATVRDELERRRIFVSLRGRAIRVSAHVYNTPDDVAALRQALLEAAAAPA